jgi:hypothetical protein
MLQIDERLSWRDVEHEQKAQVHALVRSWPLFRPRAKLTRRSLLMQAMNACPWLRVYEKGWLIDKVAASRLVGVHKEIVRLEKDGLDSFTAMKVRRSIVARLVLCSCTSVLRTSSMAPTRRTMNPTMIPTMICQSSFVVDRPRGLQLGASFPLFFS